MRLSRRDYFDETLKKWRSTFTLRLRGKPRVRQERKTAESIAITGFRMTAYRSLYDQFGAAVTSATGRMRAYNCETAPGHFLTLIQQAKLQPSHAINRVHESRIEGQIFAVKLSLGSSAIVKSSLNTFEGKRESVMNAYLYS